jgi:hypothetical protein
MDEYKHIETCIGRYIADNYLHAVEVGIGKNTVAAQILSRAGILLRSTDVKKMPVPDDLAFIIDDVFSPDISLRDTPCHRDDPAPDRACRESQLRSYCLSSRF